MKRLKTFLLSICMVCSLAACSNDSKEEVVEEEKTLQIVDTYDYGSSVVETEAVDPSYFNDCLFVGDSRIGALSLFEACKGADIAYVSALNLVRIEAMQVDGVNEAMTLVDVLNGTNKKNVYLMVGINEIRNVYFDSFKEAYSELITNLKSSHPDVNVYLLMNYTPVRVSGMNDEEIANQLAQLNACVKELALEHSVYFLDVDQGLDDASGKINEAYVSDGLHLNREGTKAFEMFILKHTVDRASYLKEMYV